MKDEFEDMGNVVEFVPRDRFDDTLTDLSSKSGKLTKKDFSRRQVVDAFTEAFETIGGVSRLAMWGHENPTEFYKLYARLLPSQSAKDVENTKEVHIIHVLPKTKLDRG